MKLPVRPLPYAGESTVGYIQRIAVSNGFENARRLAAVATNDDLFKREGHWYQLIQTWTGHSDEQLNALSVRRVTQRHYCIYGKEVPHRHIVSALNICPLCWVNETYHRAAWQIVWKPVCETHHLPLISFPCKDSEPLLATLLRDRSLPSIATDENTFSEAQLTRVVAKQNMLNSAIKDARESPLEFNQACNYVDRLVEYLRITHRRRNPWAVNSGFDMPQRVITAMAEDRL